MSVTRHARRDHGPVVQPLEIGQPPELAKVVVTAREVEQEIADGVDPEAGPRPPEHGRGRQAGPPDREIERATGSAGISSVGRGRSDRPARDRPPCGRPSRGRPVPELGSPPVTRSGRSLDRDEVPVVRLPAVDDLDVDPGGRLADPARELLGLVEVAVSP